MGVQSPDVSSVSVVELPGTWHLVSLGLSFPTVGCFFRPGDAGSGMAARLLTNPHVMQSGLKKEGSARLGFGEVPI